MSLKITSVRDATISEWDEFYESCPASTFFQSRRWAEIWQDYTDGDITPEPKLVGFADGQKILLPFSIKRLNLGIKRFLSSPAGTYGGWLYKGDKQPDEHHIPLLRAFLDGKNIVLRQNPIDPIIQSTEDHIGWTGNDFTQLISLDTEFERIMDGWRSSAKRNLKKARGNNLRVVEGKDLATWKEYYHIYQESLKRWGEDASSEYEWELFDRLFQSNIPDIKLWVVRFKDRVISGGVFFYSPTHVVYWHGAGLSDFFDKRPSELLHYKVMKHAWENDYKWYDFNPSGGHEGVVRFKKNFGPEKVQSNVFRNENRRSQIVSKIGHFIERML